MDNAEELLKKGYILYIKNGKIELIEPPEFGEINLKIQDGQVVYTACDIYAKHEDYEMIVGEVIERTWKGHYFRGFLTFATEVCMLVEDIK